MKYSVKFYPEKRKEIITNVPVMLSVTYTKQRMFYYTGLRCNINQWEAGKLKKNQVTTDGKTSQNINAELGAITTAVDELFKVYEVTSVPTPDKLRSDLKIKLGKEVKIIDKEDFFSRFDQYIRDADLSDSRKISLNSILKKLKACDPETTFTKLDLQKFHSYLLGSKTLSRNSIALIFNGLKSFIKHSIKKGHTTTNPFEYFIYNAEKYGNPVYLSIEERDILFNATIEDKTLSKVRDIFVLQCFVGCRYGDLMRLKHSNVIDGWVEYIAAKTKDGEPRIAHVPLSGKAKEILSRYDLPDRRLIPLMDLGDYNYYIKKLFRLIGLSRIVTIKDKETLLDTQVQICDIASSHMSRRVFIGGLHKGGAKNEVIASMSGHVADSKSFARYYEIDKETQIAAMKLIE